RPSRPYRAPRGVGHHGGRAQVVAQDQVQARRGIRGMLEETDDPALPVQPRPAKAALAIGLGEQLPPVIEVAVTLAARLPDDPLAEGVVPIAADDAPVHDDAADAALGAVAKLHAPVPRRQAGAGGRTGRVDAACAARGIAMPDRIPGRPPGE